MKPSTGTIVASAPVLLVADVQKSAEYYRDRVGFAVENLYGAPPHFAILSRDGFKLCLSRTARRSQIVPHYKVVPGMWNVYFWVTGVDAVYAELKSRGATIDYELGNKDYGVREFGIQDEDGYDIAFGEILQNPASEVSP